MSFSRKIQEHRKTNQCFMSKDQIKLRFIFPALLGVLFFFMGSANLFAQKAKKNKARINVEYVKLMNGKIFFNIKASSRVNKETIALSNIDLTVYNVLDDEDIELGTARTNAKGESSFSLNSINAIKADSTDTYHILVAFAGNDAFKKAKKSIEFKDANIEAKIITKDSVNYVTAVLTDAKTNEPIADQLLRVQVQRLFKPLRIGEEFNSTDEEGAISVAVEEGIPGLDGNLTLEVVLNESDDYGTIKSMVTGNIGVAFVDESTYDQRTMWSPRGKTPYFLLFLTYSGIFVAWGFIVYLFINLFKLSKS